MQKNEKRMRSGAVISNFFAALPPFLWVAAFLAWVMTGRKKPLVLTIAGAVFMLIYALAMLLTVSKMRSGAGMLMPTEPFIPKTRQDRPQKRHPVGRIVFRVFLSRIALFFGLYFINVAANGYRAGMFELPGLFAPARFATPAQALFGLEAKDVLLGSNLARFPLFPLMANALGKVLVSPVYAGCLISNLCLTAAAPLMYEYVLNDGTPADGKRAVVWLALGPASVIALFANEASLVLLLSLAAISASRRNKCLLAAAAGFLAVLAHPVALTVLIPLVWDRISALILARQLRQTLSPVRTGFRLLFSVLPLLALGVPDLLCRSLYGLSIPLTGGLDVLFYLEEPAERIAVLAASPETGAALVSSLLPVLFPLALALVALLAARSGRPADTVALLALPLVWSVMSVRASFPLTLVSWPLTAQLALLGKYRWFRETAAVAGVLTAAALYLMLSLGRLPF